MTSGRILDKTCSRVNHRITERREVRRLVAGKKALQSHQQLTGPLGMIGESRECRSYLSHRSGST